ncbi:MAG TPA: cytidylate kinase-like family protein [Methylomirabilota bacterium]|nr:cytidylate kinase-like family protein [Methylomirabilota bacterium]
MAIVTISQQVGSGGAEIGLALAERLGYCFVDHERFLERTQRYGLDAHRLSHLEEEPPSLFERFDHETHRYIVVIQTVLFEIAAEDRAVVVGRGGQWLLRDLPHAVRLRVVAPAAFRVEELTTALSSHGGERMSAHIAAQLVHRDDTQKLRRMRYLFNVDLNDPALYHLVINTGGLSRPAVVDLILALVGQPGFATTEPGRRMVADRLLASRVEVALASHPVTRRYQVEVKATGGLVTLVGCGAALEAAPEATRDVPGLLEIKPVIVETPPVPPFVG